MKMVTITVTILASTPTYNNILFIISTQCVICCFKVSWIGFGLAVNVFIVKIVLKVIPIMCICVVIVIAVVCGLPYFPRIRTIIKTFIVKVIVLGVNHLYKTLLFFME